MTTPDERIPGLLARAVQFQRQGRVADAIRDYRAILAIAPDNGSATTGLGLALHTIRDLSAASQILRRALFLDPSDARAWNGLGMINLETGNFREGESCLREAASHDPGNAVPWFNLSKLLFLERRWEEAADAFETVHRLAPNRAEPLVGLARIAYQCGRVEDAIATAERACALVPGDAYAETSRLFLHNYRQILTVRGLREAHMAFGEALCARHAGELPPPRTPPRSGRLRVGYTAWNWFDHPNLRCALPVIEAHDPSQVEIFCYHLGDQADELTRRLQNGVEHWRNLRGLPPAEAARRIQGDGLSILVGQEGHFQDGVVAVMARRIAAVQVAWSGYPHGWGLPTVDFRITDAVLDPPEWDALPTCERVIRLPWFRSFLPPATAPEPGPLPAAENGFITFVSFNNLAKVSGECLRLWSEVLNAVPNSRLLLTQAPEGPVRERIAQRLGEAGINLSRVEFLARLPTPEYLETHRRADIHLDTTPYPGVTIWATALWMGLPSVCLNQDWAASREGASQAIAAGFPELVVADGAAFVALNARLASDLSALAEFRRSARDRMRSSRLLDGAALARNLEAAYRTIAPNGSRGS